jgi:hypothetical protein
MNGRRLLRCAPTAGGTRIPRLVRRQERQGTTQQRERAGCRVPQRVSAGGRTGRWRRSAHAQSHSAGLSLSEIGGRSMNASIRKWLTRG